MKKKNEEKEIWLEASVLIVVSHPRIRKQLKKKKEEEEEEEEEKEDGTLSVVAFLFSSTTSPSSPLDRLSIICICTR